MKKIKVRKFTQKTPYSILRVIQTESTDGISQEVIITPRKSELTKTK